jgi:hypothetical protein
MKGYGSAAMTLVENQIHQLGFVSNHFVDEASLGLK